MMTPKQAPAVQPVAPAVAPATPTPVVAAPATAPAPSKQQTTLTKLMAAWGARGVKDLDKVKVTAEGKNLVVIVGPGWPTISIGQHGGVTLMEIRSCADAFAAAVIGDEMLAKQAARDTKKATPATPPVAAVAAAVAAPAVTKPAEPPKEEPKPTPAARKRQQHQQLEQQLQA